MDVSKLRKLRQIEIAKPCPEDWDAMDGDDQRRFCAGCACFVHNIAEFEPEEAEQLLAQSGRVCTRVVSDAKKGILTRGGWIPRLALAGAVAVSVNGCTTGEAASPNQPTPEKKVAQGTVPSVIEPSAPARTQFEDSKTLTTTGVRMIVQESEKSTTKKKHLKA